MEVKLWMEVATVAISEVKLRADVQRKKGLVISVVIIIIFRKVR